MEYRSAYIPQVTFRNDVQTKAVDHLIESIVSRFCDAKELREPKKIEPSDAITDLDFKQTGDDGRPAIRFDYIYRVVMKDARKVDGKIDHAAYTLTFDHELTPQKCETTGIHYGSLNLAGQPVLYYIRLELSELIKEARKYRFLP